MEWVSTYILQHIDFGTLAILFCLMGVVAGFQMLGYIDDIARVITMKAKNLRMLLVTLTMVCFFLSMLVTNDVALIIMVPFAIQVLHRVGQEDKLIQLVVLQTIAANLGSMATPIGNPQNVYLYQYYQLDLVTFVKGLFPYVLVSAILLVFILWLDKDGTRAVVLLDEENKHQDFGKWEKGMKTIVYIILFVICLLTVLDVICWPIMLAIVGIGIGLCEYRLFKEINYGLLGKFVVLFLIVGNIAAIPWIREYLQSIVSGNEFILGILFSQFMSNVPAAIMMSKFTEQGMNLLLGVNVGGLGTLIASMASIISLEFFSKAMPDQKKKYVMKFTGYNLIFLVVLCIVKVAL